MTNIYLLVLSLDLSSDREGNGVKLGSSSLRFIRDLKVIELKRLSMTHERKTMYSFLNCKQNLAFPPINRNQRHFIPYYTVATFSGSIRWCLKLLVLGP